MKNLFRLIVLLFLTNFANSQWGVSSYYDGSIIEVLDTNTIIVADKNGRIIRTTNSGTHWQLSIPFSSFRGTWFTDIHFPTKEVGYVSGGSYFGLPSILIKTIDGGQTWDSLSSSFSSGGNFYNAIHFINKDTGFLIGDNYNILMTIDGGVTLSYLVTGTSPLLYFSDIIFTKNNVGFVSASESIIGTNKKSYSILKTTDLGQTFIPVYTDTMSGAVGFNNRVISKLFFFDNLNGYAVGGNGTFLKTTDGGNTWSSSSIAPYNPLSEVHFTSPTNGYINNTGGIYHTTDGGISWSPQQINPVSTIYKIAFANDSLGFALSDNAIYRTSNAGVLLNLKENSMLNIELFPNPTKGVFSLKTSENKILNVTIMDLSGKELMNVSSNYSQIDISNFPSGIYFLAITTEEGFATKKIIKN